MSDRSVRDEYEKCHWDNIGNDILLEWLPSGTKPQWVTASARIQM
jgi:hypothetical protein